MNTVSTNEPTRYEITARHDDGREFLVCYAAGSPSKAKLYRIVGRRADDIVKATGLPRDAKFQEGTKPRPWAKAEGWTIAYTGNTQRDVLTRNAAKPSVGA